MQGYVWQAEATMRASCTDLITLFLRLVLHFAKNSVILECIQWGEC